MTDISDNSDILTISVNADLDRILGYLEHFAVDQLPYAKAAALFGAALDAKQAMQAELFKRFTIRTGKRPWAARAMYVYPEKVSTIKKRIVDSDDASVTVASRSRLGGLLSDGGTRQRKDGQDFGIPILGGARKNKTTIIRQGRNAPEDIQRKMKGFTLPTSKNGVRIMYVRQKKGKRTEDGKDQLKAMFIMQKNVQVKPWWNLRDILAKTMQKWLPTRFVEACEYAMKTRQEKG